MSVETRPEARVVRVRGELDLATTPEFEAAVGDDPDLAGRLVLDLSECTFIDSSAIRALLRAAQGRVRAGGSAVIVASQPGTLRVLEIAGVVGVVPVAATLDEAL